jgi:hypothetical protein
VKGQLYQESVNGFVLSVDWEHSSVLPTDDLYLSQFVRSVRLKGVPELRIIVDVANMFNLCERSPLEENETVSCLSSIYVVNCCC